MLTQTPPLSAVFSHHRLDPPDPRREPDQHLTEHAVRLVHFGHTPRSRRSRGVAGVWSCACFCIMRFGPSARGSPQKGLSAIWVATELRQPRMS